MRNANPFFIAVCIAVSFICCKPCIAQVNEDSILLSHSEKYKVTLNKGLAGLAKPAFGSYSVVEATRFDSTRTRKKIKDSTAVTGDVSSDGIDLDESKYLTIEKTKFYKLITTSGNSTTVSIFSIGSVSKEKRQTMLGKMLSKEDEGKDEELSYNSDVEGIIQTGDVVWHFLLEDFIHAKYQYKTASISSGYVKTADDSLYISLGGAFDTDLRLTNSKEQQLGSLKFKWKPMYTWLRNDIDKSYQDAIAAFFSIILSIKDL